MMADAWAGPTPLYEARCSVCHLEIVGTLASAPDVPLYRCGFAGRGHELARRATPIGTDVIRNVLPLSEADAFALADLSAELTFAQLPTPTIGLCEVADCGATAIDGRCLAH